MRQFNFVDDGSLDRFTPKDMPIQIQPHRGNRKGTTGKHGGKRTGAGRKPKEPTVVRRIPVSILAKVDNALKEYQRLIAAKK